MHEMAAAVEKAAFHEKKSLTYNRKIKNTLTHLLSSPLCQAPMKCRTIYFSQQHSKREFLIPVFTDEKTAPEKLNNLYKSTWALKIQGKIRIQASVAQS